MWAVYILLGLLGLLLALLLIPVTLWVIYDGRLQVRLWYLLPIRLVADFEEETNVTVTVLGCPVWTYPGGEEDKPDGEQTDGQPQQRAKGKVKELVAEMKSGGILSTLAAITELLRLLHTESGKLLTKITVTRLRLQARICGSEAAETAQLYGRVCGVLFPLLARMEQVMRVRRREVRVEPDFLSERTAVRMDMRLRLTLPRLIMAVYAVVKGIDQLGEK